MINFSAYFYFADFPDRVWRARIELNIVKNTLRFELEPEFIELSVGQEFEWTLPKVVDAYMNNYEIEMAPDIPLIPYLSYRKDNDTVFFNDRHGAI